MIRFTLDGASRAGGAGREHLAGGAARRRGDPASLPPARARATARTAIAAPAWWRSRANACSPPPASARRARAWWCAPRPTRAEAHAADGVRTAAGRPARGRGARCLRRLRALGARGSASTRSPLRAGGRAAGARSLASRDGGAARRLHPVRPVRARLPRGAAQRRHRHGAARHGRRRSSSTCSTRWARRTCVACGECVQACPTGALLPKSVLDDAGRRARAAGARGGERLPLLRRRLPGRLPRARTARSRRWSGATARPTRAGSASRAASASTTSATRTA